MDGLSEDEIAAIVATSEPAGSYLEAIGKTDLAKLTESEWMTFLECVVCTALEYLTEKSIANIPFPELAPTCSVCGGKQRNTPSGMVCDNGHGGA